MSHGLTTHCPLCLGETTLWGSEATEEFDHPVSNCPDCLILLDTGDKLA